jgi:hypothetical protein
MLTLNIGFEKPIISLDGSNTSQALHVEDDFIFEFSLFMLLILIHHELEIFILSKIASSVL